MTSPVLTLKSKRVCVVEGCTSLTKYKAAELCGKHYQRKRKHGDPNAPGRRVAVPCMVRDCVRKARNKGYCPKHAYRVNAHGDPDYTKYATGSIETKLRFYGWKTSDTGCWVWQGPVDDKGYAQMSVSSRLVKGHRVAYEHWNGPIPDGLVVRHTCDNPPCINPDHLITGTLADNIQDKVDRNRQARGTGTSAAKLVEQQVLEIRERRAGGCTLRVLALEYGVSEATVSHIALRKTWTHI